MAIARNPFQLRVLARMKALKLRQQDVVMRGGLSQSALSFVQSGRIKSLGMENIFRLADALECDARWLALGEGTPDNGIRYVFTKEPVDKNHIPDYELVDRRVKTDSVNKFRGS